VIVETSEVSEGRGYEHRDCPKHERAKEFLDVWRHYASNIVAHEVIECGHYIQEEVPDKVIQHFAGFFKI
jgi:hypothetical protein